MKGKRLEDLQKITQIFNNQILFQDTNEAWEADSSIT